MASIAPAQVKDFKEHELVEEINKSVDSLHVVSTVLKTDERVIARVTDGIYRQPASALRELISNAYDADATRVVIKTDPPRFQRISIEDDGHGMTPEALAYLLYHIGGSAKRKEEGEKLGITSHDPLYSPGGRRLIGKIGIGLFSVSQLTHSFQIITKVAGESFRTIATVVLKQYSEDERVVSEGKEKFESGRVNIWRERAADTDAHGTTIVLTSIRPQARDTLRSREVWSAIEQNENLPEEEEKQAIEPPRFHIGRIDPNSGELLKKTSGKYDSLPWDRSHSPEEAFRKLVYAVWEQVEEVNNPRLDRIFDYYLRMVWQLSLAVPLPYVEGHIFDLPIDQERVFELSNTSKGSATELGIKGNRTIREALKLNTPSSPKGRFDIFFDDLKLLRPIRFKNLPTTTHTLKHPLIFVGKCKETFSRVQIELSGGPLSFEAYLFWTPKVAPTEHQGSLIRIHCSSGTLFDPTFMRYQISEQTRLRQVTCEIFVHEGLDSALNIDRESFNYAHPHSVFITKWLHSALRQLATTQKKLASEVRKQVRTETVTNVASQVRKVVDDVWSKETDDPASEPPAVEITSPEKGKAKSPQGDVYRYARDAVIGPTRRPRTSKEKLRYSVLEEKVKAIAQILASYGLLDQIPKRKQEQLLRAIYKVLEAREE